MQAHNPRFSPEKQNTSNYMIETWDSDQCLYHKWNESLYGVWGQYSLNNPGKLGNKRDSFCIKLLAKSAEVWGIA